MAAALERAHHDPDFGFALAMQLQECVTQKEDVDSLADADLGRLSSRERDSLLQQLAAAEAHCHGIENSPKQRYELIDRAAAAGIIDAQVAFRAVAADFFQTEEAIMRSGAIDEFKAKTVRYAIEAARSRQPSALYNAYDVTSNPMFGSVDPVTSLAYLLAYNHVSSGKGARLIPMAQRNLSAAQLASAQRMAQQLLAGH